MDTEIIRIKKEGKEGTLSEEDLATINHAGEIIKQGGLVAFPTETVYGLGGNALDPESSKKIYAAKGRPSDNPLIVHIADFQDIYSISRDVPHEAKKLAEVFWPGPLTMILKKDPKVPMETTGGLDTVAVRLPSDVIARELIKASGGFVAAPSANISGKPSPTEVKYVIEDMMGRIHAIIDGGEGEIGIESTIVDLTVTPPIVLRPGFITNEMIGSVLETDVETDRAIIDADSGLKPKAPGMKYRHYAPKGELVIVEGRDEEVVRKINERLEEDRASGFKTGAICCDENKDVYNADVIKLSGKKGDTRQAAHRLYSILRSFDDEGVEKIYSEGFEREGFGAAIMNRLLKAAGHKIINL
ncbi:MAG: threonylcarbamoyl-AMP synthase [Lachnospiraceae bacterium]|nr:threonylcarbamoyl-AMP synthase [Lachnospiraceae bacterium]